MKMITLCPSIQDACTENVERRFGKGKVKTNRDIYVILEDEMVPSY